MKYILFFIVTSLSMIVSAYNEKDTIIAGVIYKGDIGAKNLEEMIYNLQKESQITRGIYNFNRINAPGLYTLASHVANRITIDASDVTLDLNGCIITDGITINNDLSNITVENGIVKTSTEGITINAGCNNIFLRDLIIQNGLYGIRCHQLNNSSISNCDMITNTTGLELNESHNILIEHCTAHANVQAGFSLLSTTSVAVEDCKAIAIGEGNNHTFGDASHVFGFVSHNGYGNIFERCIANATQATTTTSSESIVAGFGLKGNESSSKIIESEVGNSRSASNGLTIPYGIWLQSRLDSVISVTATNQVTATDSAIAHWSPDGNYLAVAQNTSGLPSQIVLYRFDRSNARLIAVNTVIPDNNTGIFDFIVKIQWSPNNQFLLAGGATFSGTFINSLFLYRFDQPHETLVSVLEMTPNGPTVSDVIEAIAWSPDNKYVAIGISSTDLPQGFTFFIYRFDPIAQTLTQVVALNPDGLDTSLNFPRAIAWSPDGTYVVVGGTFFNLDETLFIYKFNRSTESIAQVDAVNIGGGFSDTIRTVAWTPNGTYLAVGGSMQGTPPHDLILYRFDYLTEKVTKVDSINPGGGNDSDEVYTVSWSADSNYLVVGGDINTNGVYIFKFNRFTQTLAQVASLNPSGSSDTDRILSVDWSPDGGYLAISGRIDGGNNIYIYTGLQFPRNNIISNNILYCDSGTNSPGGVGISGSSFANLIIGNVAYANPMNPAIVSSNYYFVTNVFNPLFNDMPSAVQNVQLSSKIPIPSVYDIPAGLNRLEILAQSLVDNLL